MIKHVFVSLNFMQNKIFMLCGQKPGKKESILPNSNFIKCKNRQHLYTVIDTPIVVPSGEGADEGEQEGPPGGQQTPSL